MLEHSLMVKNIIGDTNSEDTYLDWDLLDWEGALEGREASEEAKEG